VLLSLVISGLQFACFLKSANKAGSRRRELPSHKKTDPKLDRFQIIDSQSRFGRVKLQIIDRKMWKIPAFINKYHSA
jgi:hypothetical protein